MLPLVQHNPHKKKQQLEVAESATAQAKPIHALYLNLLRLLSVGPNEGFYGVLVANRRQLGP